MLESSDYREILRKALNTRARANPHYSLRAFARDLRIFPSRLSQILSNKQGLSVQSARLIAERLGFSAEDVEHFTLLVEVSDARSKQSRKQAEARLRQLESGSAATSSTSVATTGTGSFREWIEAVIPALEKIDREGVTSLPRVQHHLTRSELPTVKQHLQTLLEALQRHPPSPPEGSSPPILTICLKSPSANIK